MRKEFYSNNSKQVTNYHYNSVREIKTFSINKLLVYLLTF